MNKLLIIDGSGLLVSNYYGTLPPEVQYAKTQEEAEKNYDKIAQHNGYYINALYPTIKQIIEYSLLSNTTHLTVCFDKSRKDTFRKKMYTDYKSNRKKTPLPLKQQFILCEEILKSIGISVFYDDKYEADDFAGSIAAQINEPNLEKIILSKDKDYLQLADENTTIWMMLARKEMADNILSKYKLTKEAGYKEYLPDKVVPYNLDIIKKEKNVFAPNFADVLALAGDKADNIPGVNGISEETAEKLIGYYNNIESLYNDIDLNIENNSIDTMKNMWKNDLKIKRSPYNALIKYRDDAFLSSKLTKIKRDINMNELCPNFNFESLKIKGFLLNILENNTYITSEIRTNIQNVINEIIDKKG